MNMMNFTRVALKNLFSKPVTRPYPAQPRDYPARTRGQVAIDMDACILCGMCMRKCPAGAIQVDRAARTWSIERFGCIQCNSCVESCPRSACIWSKATHSRTRTNGWIRWKSHPNRPRNRRQPLQNRNNRNTYCNVLSDCYE